jgi:uncharacterized protein
MSISVGVLTVRLRLPENSTLKGKRSVIKSVIAQVNNKFNVSVAEVEDQDAWQISTLGVACVSNDSQHNNEVLSRVVNFIDSGRFDLELLDYHIEILPV